MIPAPKINTIKNSVFPSISNLICSAIVNNRPQLLTALPNVEPPIAKITIVPYKIIKIFCG